MLQSCCLGSLSHGNNDVVAFFPFRIRNYASFNCLAVYGDAPNSLFYIVGIYYLNAVSSFSELSCKLKVIEALRYTGIDAVYELGLAVPDEYILEAAYRDTWKAYRMTEKLISLIEKPKTTIVEQVIIRGEVFQGKSVKKI